MVRVAYVVAMCLRLPKLNVLDSKGFDVTIRVDDACPGGARSNIDADEMVLFSGCKHGH